MKKASNYAFLSKPKMRVRQQIQEPQFNLLRHLQEEDSGDLNVFVVTFDAMKDAEKNLAGGDPYSCKKCMAILNKYSKITPYKEYNQKNQGIKISMKPTQSLWNCQFCLYPNIISIEPQQFPVKDDVFYMLESEHQNNVTENDSTLIFCVDTSGSMNTTTEVKGKVDLKFGLTEEQINMLKQFMEPGDEAQFNFLPGAHNQNKTFISRKQCILSAIESHLQELKKSDPFKRVGFVTFNNEIIAFGDDKIETVNIVGDKLQKKQQILKSLQAFKLTQPLSECYESLVKKLNQSQAKGQTALGPALLTAIQIASKGSPGSTVTLCTDGLANIGLGSFQSMQEEKSKKFYQQIAEIAKQKNVIVNFMTIKGQGSKMSIVGKATEVTNGKVKVLNPEQLTEDFANVMKDELVGVNVEARIILHKAMNFRNEDIANLKQNKTVLQKHFVNATVKTKVSFQYEVRDEQDLKFMEIDITKLEKVPFQAQIVFTTPKGSKLLRVISSQSKTTTQKQVMKKQANLPVVHHRITSFTAQMYSKGDYQGSQRFNDNWKEYLEKNFQQEKYHSKQTQFMEKNQRLNKALRHKYQKKLVKPKISEVKEQKQGNVSDSDSSGSLQMRKSCIDSDSDHQQLMDNLMQKRSWKFDSQGSDEEKQKEKQPQKKEQKQQKKQQNTQQKKQQEQKPKNNIVDS